MKRSRPLLSQNQTPWPIGLYSVKERRKKEEEERE